MSSCRNLRSAPDPFDALLRDVARAETRAPPTTSSGLPVGSRIAGRYVVQSILGRGGASIVYCAHDEFFQESVAIKVLRYAGRDAVQRTRREVQAMRMLDPARVARLFDAGETETGEPYIAMELVRGTTARVLIKRGLLEVTEALRIVREVAETLAAAHRLGLVHRDVKPDNVLVQDDGRVVLLDFGIVKQVVGGDESPRFITDDGMIMGTPSYLAPEQAMASVTGPAADQFSLAVTAFELLTGRLPWSARGAVHVLAQILHEAPLEASRANTRVPPQLDAVFARAMAKEARERFPSTSAFVDAMDAAVRGEPLAKCGAR